MRNSSLLLRIFVVSAFWSVAVFAQSNIDTSTAASGLKPSATTSEQASTSAPAEKSEQFPPPVPSAEIFASAQEAFLAATQAYQQGKFELADQRFATASQLDQNQNARTLYNWALTKQKLGQKGKAAGLWRRARQISPRDRLSTVSLDALIATLEHRELAHQSSIWESYRALVLIWLPPFAALIVSWLLLSATAFLWLRYVGKKRKARLDEQEPPKIGFTRPLLSILAFCSVFLVFSKMYDSQELRATVIDQKIEARSSPDTSSPAIFELFEGLEVIVEQTKDSWTQVTYPGGLTGWVPTRTLLKSSGQEL